MPRVIIEVPDEPNTEEKAVVKYETSVKQPSDEVSGPIKEVILKFNEKHGGETMKETEEVKLNLPSAQESSRSLKEELSN